MVHPGHTGKGYGRMLMEHAIDWARRSGKVEKIELRVRSTNPTALALYDDSLGFSREGKLKRRGKLKRGDTNDVCMALFIGKTTGQQQRAADVRHDSATMPVD